VARAIIETLGRAGFFLLSIAFLLAVALLFVVTLQFGERAYRQRRAADMALAFYLCIFGLFCLSHTLLALLTPSQEQDWLNVTFNLLSALAIWWPVIRFAVGNVWWVAKGAVVLVALAYTGWFWAGFFSISGVRGIIGEDSLLDRPVDALHLGELAAVLAPIAFFAAIAVPGGRWRHWKRWIAPGIVGLLFAAGNIADIIVNQGFTGVFSIWSVGFTLFLPWPLYAISLVLFLYTLLTCVARGVIAPTRYGGANVGMGLLLLPFAGYYLQLTYQHLLAALALMLLTGIARPLRKPVVRRREAETLEHATT
jgi:hypothetical protein